VTTESAAILLLRRILYAGRKDLGDWWRTANISGDLMDEVERFLGQVDPARCSHGFTTHLDCGWINGEQRGKPQGGTEEA
jgi:hypothetical protein